MVTGSNVKSTWELAGRLAGSFETSTRRAQSQLSQLRREYSANQQELRRMQTVLKTAAQGTDAYANAQRRVPQLQEDISRQAFAISDVQKEALGGARAQGQMANATGRAGSALRALTTFGLAAGAAIGVAAGAVTYLTKALNASGREAQALQTLSIRGIDPTAYQQASNRLQVLTGDAATARRTVDSLTEAGQRVRNALVFDPRSLGTQELRAISALGFDGPKEFAEATRDASGFVERLRGELRGANQAKQDYIRAASAAAGLDSTLVDSILEENRLLARQAELRRQAAAGDTSGVQDLERITQRLERIRTQQGIISPEQRDALERYDEVMQGLSLAGRDLKIAFTTSFADDLQAAAEHLTSFITRASELWDQIRGESDTRTPAERRPGAGDYANLITGQNERPAGDYIADIGRLVKDQAYYGKQAYQDLSRLNDTVSGFFDKNINQRLGLPSSGNVGVSDLKSLDDRITGFFDKNINQRLGLPSFARGGVVPGQEGRPQLAMVHGGEEVVSARDRRASGRSISMTNYFTIDGTRNESIAQDVAGALQNLLATGISW